MKSARSFPCAEGAPFWPWSPSARCRMLLQFGGTGGGDAGLSAEAAAPDGAVEASTVLLDGGADASDSPRDRPSGCVGSRRFGRWNRRVRRYGHGFKSGWKSRRFRDRLRFLPMPQGRCRLLRPGDGLNRELECGVHPQPGV